MKRSLSLLLLACLVLAPARAELLGRVIEITAVPGWKIAASDDENDASSRFPLLKYVPADGRHASLVVSLLPANTPRHEVTDFASLTRFNLMMSRPYLADAVTAPEPAPLKVIDGIGVQLTHEDPALIGKPVPSDENRFVTVASVLLAGRYLVHAELFYDERDSVDFKEGMKILLSASPRPMNPPI
jgi:hypothetical protein